MLGHMRKHHTKVPSINTQTTRAEEEKTIPWRETAKEYTL